MIKGSLTPLDPKGDPIYFQFNPTEFARSKDVEWAEIAVPGLDFPLQQFVRGGLESLALEIYMNLDAYGYFRDVPADIARLEALTQSTDPTLAPPICLLHYGTVDFTCVVGSFEARYTMFNDIGEAIEATVRLTLKRYLEKDVTFELPSREVLQFQKKKPVFAGANAPGSRFERPELARLRRAQEIAKRWNSGRGQTATIAGSHTTYQSVANEKYGDPSLWRAVEFTNRGRRSWDNLRAIKKGDRFAIPDMENAMSILEDTTNFPPEVREATAMGRRKMQESTGLLRAVRR